MNSCTRIDEKLRSDIYNHSLKYGKTQAVKMLSDQLNIPQKHAKKALKEIIDEMNLWKAKSLKSILK